MARIPHRCFSIAPDDLEHCAWCDKPLLEGDRAFEDDGDIFCSVVCATECSEHDEAAARFRLRCALDRLDSHLYDDL